jgi:uncharacterized protein YlxW (UPF0749 family)
MWIRLLGSIIGSFMGIFAAEYFLKKWKLKCSIEAIEQSFDRHKGFLNEHRKGYERLFDSLQKKVEDLHRKVANLETRINDYELCNVEIVTPKEKND